MKKYLVLYRASTSASEMMAHATPELMKAGMDAWMAWAHRAGSAVVELGHPLGHPHYFSGTPSHQTGHISGYSILQAEDEGALRIVLNGHPHIQVPGNSIETHEFLSMPGM